jgi:putative membrane protein
MRTNPQPNPWRGLLAGAVAGLVASFVMSQFHSIVQTVGSSRKQGGEDSTVKTASAVSKRIFHHELTRRQKKIAGPAVHYAFGSTVAATYGAAVETAPFLRVGWGLPFGAAVWLGAHVITVPTLGLSEGVAASPLRQEATEFVAHLLYGGAVEGIRRLIRTRMLG